MSDQRSQRDAEIRPMQARCSMFFLGLVSGSLIAAIPIIFYASRDPTDQSGSYAVWWIGFFVASAIIGFREPNHAKSAAWGVGLGLPVAFMGSFVIEPGSANLWPLALIYGTVVGMPAAWLGARVVEWWHRAMTLHEGRDETNVK